MGEYRLTIDRFEGAWAVVEYAGETFDIPRSLLPPHAREGDVVTVAFEVDESETAKRRERVQRLVDELFE